MTTENDEQIDIMQTMLTLEGDQMSLGDLAGIDMSVIKSKSFEMLPAGSYIFEVSMEAEKMPRFGVSEYDDKDVPGGKINVASVIFDLSVIDVLGIKKPEDVPAEGKDSLIGKNHRERFRIDPKDPMGSLGYAKDFMEKIQGLKRDTLVGNYKAMLEGCAGLRFQAPIRVTVNQNNTDIEYHNIDRTKIVPKGQAAGSTVEGVGKAA